MELTLVALGAGVGLLVGLTSTGGGTLLTPVLLLFGVSPSLSVGTGVLAASAMKLFGGGLFALRGQVHTKTVLRLAAGSLPGAGLGLFVLSRLSPHQLEPFLRRGVGLVLVLAGVSTLLRLRWAHSSQGRPFPGRRLTAALGFGVGLLVSLTGIGSGSVVLCVLTLCFPLGSQTLVGTVLAHALLLSGVTTCGHLLAGRVDLGLGASILLGGVPGVVVGAHWAGALPERGLRLGLAALLIVMGIHLSLPAGSRPSPALRTAWLGDRR
ncbi:MAG TPA: sulfite exporter TauE/SafE family protein [Vicinamibacteria bacterium]|nr:sulfite exporter TauE/SafE family protein [Vicinamibacteria bacterium]